MSDTVLQVDPSILKFLVRALRHPIDAAKKGVSPSDEWDEFNRPKTEREKMMEAIKLRKEQLSGESFK